MLKRNETIYLFSSRSREQYIQDVLNILALPSGAIFHFRYNLKYVAKKLSPEQNEKRDQYEHRLQSYRGNEVIIVFVDQPEKTVGLTVDKDINFYPLRKAKIKEFALDGIVLHVFFELDHYINLNQQRYNSFNQEIKHLGRNDQRPPNKYISIGLNVSRGDPVISPDQYASTWMQTIDTLSKLDIFSNTVFYRCVKIRKVRADQVAQKSVQRFWTASILSNKNKEKEVTIDEIFPYQSGYVLESGGIYALDLSFYHSEEVKKPVLGSKIVVQVDKARFAFQPDDIEVNFRYDVHTVELVTIPITQDAFTSLRLSVEKEKDNQDNPPLRSPITDFVFKLTYPRFRFVGALVLLIAAQILVAVPDVITALPVQQAIIKVLGSVITAVVLFIMLRKLPGS